jgi:peptidylprolyl isomerase
MSEVEGREDAETGEAQEEAESQRPNVKMREAKDIGRSVDFTPHALASKSRSAPRSGTRAAAKRRRTFYAIGAVVVVAALAVGIVAYENRPAPSVKIKGAFGKAPSVSVPKATPATKTQVKELIHGTGPKVGSDSVVDAQVVVYRWSSSGGKELLNTFKKGQHAVAAPLRLTGMPALDTELDKQLAGRSAGSRLQVTVPEKATNGKAANTDLAASVDVINSHPEPTVTVSGSFGKAPTVTIPKAAPAAKKQVKELIHGSGPVVGKTDFAVVHMVAYKWNNTGGNQLVLDTYKKGTPATGQSTKLTGLPALDNELAGRTTGTRVQLTLPYSAVGAQVAQALQLTPTDDFVVSADVMNVYGKTATAKGKTVKADPTLPAVTPGAPGVAPTIKIPSGSPPKTLKQETLIQGSGKAVKKGQTLIAQYDGVLWGSGKVFDSSWQHGAPAGFPIGVGQVIPGWDKTLVGQKIGSRVLLVVPPKEGYGAKGSQDGSIKGTDTLVFVVDILGAY